MRVRDCIRTFLPEAGRCFFRAARKIQNNGRASWQHWQWTRISQASCKTTEKKIIEKLVEKDIFFYLKQCFNLLRPFWWKMSIAGSHNIWVLLTLKEISSWLSSAKQLTLLLVLSFRSAFHNIFCVLFKELQVYCCKILAYPIFHLD